MIGRFDVALPAGLIDEIFSNSLKHAFPEGPGGEILVAVREQSESAVLTKVADAGIGLPAHVDANQSGSLGLARMLARQLEASLVVRSGSGADVLVRFNIGAGRGASAGSEAVRCNGAI